MNDAEYIERAKENILVGNGSRQMVALVARVKELEAEVVWLREALLRFGDHEEPCEYGAGYGGVVLECKCGWAQVAQAARAAGGGDE